MGTVLGGTEGSIDGVDTVGRWEVTSTADLQAVITSNTKKGTILLDGNTDWTGTWVTKKGQPDHMPGEGFTFTGTIDETNGATGTAIVDSVEMTCNIETGEALSITLSFSGNGALSLGAAVATDTTTPDPPSSIGCSITLGTDVATPVYTEVDDVRSWTLTITADNKPYVSSSTAGGTKRVAGNISAEITFDVYDDDFADIPAVNDLKYTRLYTTASQYWDIGLTKVREAGNLAVDIETGDLIGATINQGWTAYDNLSTGSAVEGYIKYPTGSTWWPS